MNDDGKAILEAKIRGEWRRIAACSDPRIVGEIMTVDHMVVSDTPEFLIVPIGIEDWLRRRLLIVTRIKETPHCKSSTSWTCLYKGAKSIVALDGVYALSGVEFET